MFATHNGFLTNFKKEEVINSIVFFLYVLPIYDYFDVCEPIAKFSFLLEMVYLSIRSI